MSVTKKLNIARHGRSFSFSSFLLVVGCCVFWKLIAVYYNEKSERRNTKSRENWERREWAEKQAKSNALRNENLCFNTQQRKTLTWCVGSKTARIIVRSLLSQRTLFVVSAIKLNYRRNRKIIAQLCRLRNITNQSQLESLEWSNWIWSNLESRT